MAALIILLSLLVPSPTWAQTPVAPRPNVLIILADDLGWSDLGCYGSEIQTPNLDRLAQEGLRYTSFYNTGRCWPTRGSLMTGYYAQQIRRDSVPGLRSGGQGRRPSWAPLLPERLKQAGYRNYHIGKWHIDATPLTTGFDHSYRLDDHGRYFNPRSHFVDDQPLAAIEPGTDFYVTTFMADQAILMLDRHVQDHGDSPFLMYLAFTAPHFPLHARPDDIEQVRGRYAAGWTETRQARYRKQIEQGLIRGPLSPVEVEVGPPYAFPKAYEILGSGEVTRPLPWDQLEPEQQAFQTAKMELHAAMIERMDFEIGRLLTRLQEAGLSENTLIVFLSDNGASAEIMVRDDGHDPQAPLGSAPTYSCLGPGWSSVGNTPFRRHKTWVHEGGIRTPCIVSWPAGIPASTRGSLRGTPGHVIDWTPTILELAGLPQNAAADARPSPGRSLVASFGHDRVIERDLLWWSHEGNRAIRVGDLKAVAANDEPWQLFDLAVDPAETEDLASTRVEDLNRLVALWESQWQEIQAAAADPAETLAP